MRRYNYHRSFASRTLDLVPWAFGPALHRPAACLAAILLAFILTGAFEVRRLAVLDATLRNLQAQMVTGERTSRAVQKLELEIDALRRREAALAQSRSRSATTLNDLASLGNRLPRQTWLTRVRTEADGTWSIEGRSTELAEIGATLTGLQRIQRNAAIRLVSVARTGPRARILRFAIAWERHS